MLGKDTVISRSGMLIAALAFAVTGFDSRGLAQPQYQRKTPPLDTPWTNEVSDTNPRPEYPRPQMVRAEWQSLNGVWEFGPAAEGEALPGAGQLQERILVPFPIQSALSGIMRREDESWYRRTFTVPGSWVGRRILLHFGAVTHAATVYVNGEEVGSHRGSYDAFSFDITNQLAGDGENELVVRVSDQFAEGQPVGKQFLSSVFVFFSRSSGIWQTVWLEPVPEAHIESVASTPDLEGGRLLVNVAVPGAAPTDRVRIRALADAAEVQTTTGEPGEPIALQIEEPRLWTPDDPFLYDLEVELVSGEATVDRVGSYFGMRSIGLKEVAGVTRMVLNDEFVFQVGALDQGYWPDGLYAAPTDEAFVFDIQLAKDLGFNMIRKHVKVEPERWYYWADKLGVLVWQDMPNMQVYRVVEEENEVQFEKELREMILEKRSHPSIIVWVPFNEGWGQYDVERVVSQAKQLDPSRLFSGNSGSANCCVAVEPPSTDLIDTHLYAGPYAAPPDHRASVTTEFGTCEGRTPGHEWDPAAAERNVPIPPSADANEGLIRRQWDGLRQQMVFPGLSAAVYVELYDIENELAGFYTYDRRVNRCDAALVRSLNQVLIADSRETSNLRPKKSGSLPEGLVHHFRFDEGQGATASDERGGEALSLSGATWAVDGANGTALAFGGNGAHARADGALVDASSSFTVTAWLRHEDRMQTTSAVSQAGASSGFRLGLRASDERLDLGPAYTIYPPDPNQYPPWRWTFDAPDRTGCLDDECGRRANSSYGDIGLLPPEGRWDHVAAVADRESRTISLFINGAHITSEQMDYGWSADGAFALGVDRAAEPENDSFEGAIDDLRIFDRALSAEEVRNVFVLDGGFVGEGDGGGGGCTASAPHGRGAAGALFLALLLSTLAFSRRRRSI